MIKKIDIENFRVFKDYTEFEIAPITILTGPNNSGKSSLIKILSLLKNSYLDELGINRLNFEGGNHNLGTFQNILNWNNDSKQLKLTLDFPMIHFDENFQIELIYILQHKSEDAELTSIRVFNKKRELFKVFSSLDDSDFDIIEGENDFYGFYSIDIHYLKNFLKNQDELFFDYYMLSNDKKVSANKKYRDLLLAFENIFSSLIINFDVDDGSIRYDVVTDYLKFILDFREEYLSNYFEDLNLKSDQKLPNVWNRLVDSYLVENNLTKDSLTQSQLSQMNQFVDDLSNIKICIDEKLQTKIKELIQKNFDNALNKLIYTIEGIDHLTAIRGNQKRGLSNPHGNNIDSIVKSYNSHNFTDYFLSECFKILGIKGELVIERKEGVTSFVYLKNGNTKVLLSDLGFGYSQLIPIILKINIIGNLKAEEWYGKNPYNSEDIPKRESSQKEIEELKAIKKNNLENILNLSAINILSHSKDLEYLTKYSILIIEEPEANLHPNFQSKLADILVFAQQEFNIKFILETHSEYLIRKLQYLTGRNEIETGGVNIYYFNEDKYVNEIEPKVKNIKINKFGALTDSFGPGFYDEATNLQFELMKINKGQNN